MDGAVQRARGRRLPHPSSRPGRPVAGTGVTEASPRPRVVVRADLPPALRTLAAVAVLGVPLGWVWSRLAPPEVVRVAGDGRLVPLLGESEHRFDALGVFLLLGFAAGVLTGVTAWMLRRRRGPVLLVGAVAGSLAGAWVAMRTGEALAAARYADTLLATAAGGTAARPPELESAWAVVAAPFAVAVTYSALAAWNGNDDLDRGPS